MNIIVDTSVWSLALRRKNKTESRVILKLKELIEQEELIFLLGIILQEILQGLQKLSDFKKLSNYFLPFPIIQLKRQDYIFASSLYNHCKSKGVHASTVDFIIASASIRYKCYLLTTDKDFLHIAKNSELKLL